MKARYSAGDGTSMARWVLLYIPFTYWNVKLAVVYRICICLCSLVLATQWTGTCLAVFLWTLTTRWTCPVAGGTPWCSQSRLLETWQRNYLRLTILLETCRLVQVRWCCISSCTYMHTDMCIHSLRYALQPVQRRQSLYRTAYT